VRINPQPDNRCRTLQRQLVGVADPAFVTGHGAEAAFASGALDAEARLAREMPAAHHTARELARQTCEMRAFRDATARRQHLILRKRATGWGDAPLRAIVLATPRASPAETPVSPGCTWCEVITMKRRILSAAVLVLVFSVTSVVAGPGRVSPLGFEPSPSPSPLSASIWTDKTVYIVGDVAQIYLTLSDAAYVYILDFQPDGVVRQIFPNGYSQGNYLRAGTHVLPDGAYRFVVAPPIGEEQLQILASSTPLDLVPGQYNEAFPYVAPNAESARNSLQPRIMGISPEPLWATAWTSFTIVYSYGYAPPAGPTPPNPPAYPPFFSWMMPSGQWIWEDGMWVYGEPKGGIYWTFDSDGSWRLHIRFRFGGA